MKRKRAIILLICMCMVCIFAGLLSACGGDVEYEGVKVVFELEGGKYKNSGRAVAYYYDLTEGASSKIVSPDDFAGDSKNTVTNPGYRLEGWYKTKSVDPETGEVTYADPWDFDRDTISSDTGSLTLYAAWKEYFICMYELCYWDAAGEVQSITTYQVMENAKFAAYNMNRAEQDASNKASSVGCTVYKELVEGKGTVLFYDKDGEKWDPNFTHPGDDETRATAIDTDDGTKAYVVQIFVKFVEGKFAYVSTASELNSAIGSKQNIVLMCDIDFNGAKFNGFADATTKFYGGATDFGTPVQTYVKGEGHAIKNFVLGYETGRDYLVSDSTFSRSLIISLFGIMDNVKVTDLSFTGVTIDLSTGNDLTGSIYVAPLAVMATNSIFENVKFEGTYKCTALPKNFKQSNLFVERSSAIHLRTEGDNNTVDGTTVTLTDAVTE